MPSKDHEAMLETINRAIDDGEFEPSEWEEGFLETVEGLLDFELELSEKQDEILESIWRKATQ